MKKIILTVITSLMAILVSNAQNITGDWFGQLEGNSLHLNLHITSRGQYLSGTFDSPDQNAYGIPADTLFLDGDVMTFTWKQGDLKYSGTFEKSGKEIAGYLSQLGGKYSLVFHRNQEETDWKDTASIRLYYDKRDVDIIMRDGIHLHTSIYSPKDQSRSYPVIMTRTPYGIETSEDDFSRMLPDYAHFLEDGYIVVLQDVRGKFMSEGTYVDVRPLYSF